MVFEELAEGILKFVNYGITLLVIMLIVEFIKLFRGAPGKAWGGAKGLGKKFVKQGGFEALGPRAKEKFDQIIGKEIQKPVMADIVAERAELNKLKDVKKEIGKKTPDVGKIESEIKKARNMLKSRANTFAYRVRTYTKRFIKSEKDKIGGLDVNGIESLEGKIIVFHNELDTVLGNMLEKKKYDVMGINGAIKIEQDVLKDLNGLLALEKEFRTKLKK